MIQRSLPFSIFILWALLYLVEQCHALISPRSASIRNFMSRTKHGSKQQPDKEDDENESYDVSSVNVLGTPLQPCCTDVRGTGIGTGFYRNGFCSTGSQDLGRHTVCVQVTDEFLSFSRSVGNDLSTPIPDYLFPGLQEGDRWCLCAQRWVQAYEAGMAPKVYLQATHEKTLTYTPLEILLDYAIDETDARNALDALNIQRAQLDKLFGESK
jgi:uncharacterized protein